ncbi:hypothetical protein TEA_016786 [Camellia sinensis var. sinensis]|uniref:Nudix hydrolase domain-containing protein n=1 Tax=Camellia sinensis var. sinensis TaxID=542762 RepID=A0A4S4DZY9_CAMSN|nr:hypothetical protein TEA_016786 [Camellia sinensis var. sinensis]
MVATAHLLCKDSMLSIARRVSLSMASTTRPSSPNSLSKLIMNSNNCFGGSIKLTTLVRQLRLYKPPPPTIDETTDVEEQRIEESAGKVVSQVGFVESATPIAGKPERFRPKRASVLICLFEGDDDDLRVILTKRASKLSSHSAVVAKAIGGRATELEGCDRGCDGGQRGKSSLWLLGYNRWRSLNWLWPWGLLAMVMAGGGDWATMVVGKVSREVSLPGGKAEEGDADDAETATREANEEIGLDPSLVNVVTVLEPFLSKHLLRVIPVIGILSNKKAFNPTPNAAEVEAVFDAPLEMFIKDENRRAEEREWMGDKYLIHYFDYETDSKKKYVIWGLTAGILIRAASVVYQRPPAFIEQNPKFKVSKVLDKDIL